MTGEIQQIKIFSGVKLQELENQVNIWMAENITGKTNANVNNIVFNVHEYLFTILVHYSLDN
jgi:hypothetical protein